MQLKTFLCLVVCTKQIVMVGYHGVVRVMMVVGREREILFLQHLSCRNTPIDPSLTCEGGGRLAST